MSNKKLSVIIPIYNVEKYLEEALESVVQQDIGFKDNVQLILINDGSPDQSEEICIKYRDRFPDNIQYVHQKNQGVSAARNHGLDLAKGKYVAFFDPDDKLSLDAYRKVLDFFDGHYDQIDFAAFRMDFFERITGAHPLNYKFDETRVIKVAENPTYMQSSGVSCVFKAEAMRRRRFDTSVKYAEDMKLINEILLDKMAYGVVKGPVYYVRKRMDENSASNTGHLNPEYYTVTPVKVFKYLFDLWEKTNGKLDEFIQFVVLFDLQWRIAQRAQIALTPEEEAQYRKNIRDLLQRMTSDELILGMRKIKTAYKLFLLREKYGEKTFNKQISIQDGQAYLNGLNIDEVLGCSILPGVAIDRMEHLGDGRIKLEGYISGLLSNNSHYWFETSLGKFAIEQNMHREVTSRNIFLGQQIDINEAFSVTVETDGRGTIKPYTAAAGGGGSAELRLKTGQFTRLGNVRGAYVQLGGLIVQKRTKSLAVFSANPVSLLVSELVFSLTILSRLKLRIARKELVIGWRYRLGNKNLSIKAQVDSVIRPFFIPVKALVVNIGTLLLRALARIARLFKRKELWLISDRISEAADNGEAFYSYLQNNPVAVNYYFAINKDSGSYDRLRKKGYRLVNLLGLRYKFLVLIADKVISSNADDMIFNPFLDNWSGYADIKNIKFVFLQHGLTKDDLSRQYNRWNIAFDMVVTSTQEEYDSFVKNKGYGFGKDVVKLTGMPRLDELKDESKNTVALIPTWRKGLDGGLDKRTGRRLYSPIFKETDYFKFYNDVLTDKRLKKVFEKKGVVGKFYLHPSFAAQAKDFSKNGIFEIQKMPYDYRRVFSESCLLITDYSSVAFDFAYLKKPVVYSQFDRPGFFNGHTYKEGYFSYVDDGFGPVVHTHKDLVDAIIAYINTDCAMEGAYMQRVDKLFTFNDTNNSKRVYEAIREIA